MPGPNGTTSDRFPNVDLPPTSDDAGGDTGMTYIEEAYDAMLADDEPAVSDPTATPEPSTTPAASQYPQPVTPQSQARATPQPQARQPAAAPRQPTAPQQLTQEQQAAQQAERRATEDPFGMQAELLEREEARYVDALAKNVYAISQEDMDAFLSGDSTKVSQALARVHLNAVGSVMKVVSQQMPIWVGHMLKLRDAANDAESGFWEANPGLNRRAHRDAANRIAVAYRQMNPQATPEEIYKAVGAMVATMFGVSNVQQDPRVAGNGPLPRTPGRVVRRVPQAFAPSGAQPSGATPPKIDNPWMQMTEILSADQDGLLDNVR